MTFTVTFKTPDVMDQVCDSDNMEPCETHRAKDEWGHEDCDACVEVEETKQAERDLMKVLAEKFISYGEYVTIEFNTQDQTARVLPAK